MVDTIEINDQCLPIKEVTSEPRYCARGVCALLSVVMFYDDLVVIVCALQKSEVSI